MMTTGSGFNTTVLHGFYTVLQIGEVRAWSGKSQKNLKGNIELFCFEPKNLKPKEVGTLS